MTTGARRLAVGYQDHYVVDDGRARIILAAEATILGEERTPFRLPTDAMVFLV
jgi:hypothetical protein